MRGIFALVLLAGVALAGGAAKLVMDHINLGAIAEVKGKMRPCCFVAGSQKS